MELIIDNCQLSINRYSRAGDENSARHNEIVTHIIRTKYIQILLALSPKEYFKGIANEDDYYMDFWYAFSSP